MEKKGKGYKNRRRMHGRKTALLLGTFLLAGAALGTGGCTGSSRKNKPGSVQEDNEVAGFLFHFDQREETRALVKLKNENKLPVRMSWYYPPKGTALQTQPETEEELPEETEMLFSQGVEEIAQTEKPAGPEEVEEATGLAETEAVSEPEQKETEQVEEETVQRPAPTGTTEDQDMIVTIYNALNNVIIVGNTTNTGEGKGYYISFTLVDGSECFFDFAEEGIIRLSDHNYSIETDGTLWSTLKP